MYNRWWPEGQIGTAEYTILQKQRHEDLVKRVQDRWLN